MASDNQLPLPAAADLNPLPSLKVRASATPVSGEEPAKSPLTFGKVFGAIPRVTGVSTPNINEKIAKPWNLPAVSNSAEFKKSYVDGRAKLRYVNSNCSDFSIFFLQKDQAKISFKRQGDKLCMSLKFGKIYFKTP